MAKGGLEVQASIPSDKECASGRLFFVDNAVDPATGTIQLKGIFANEDGRLLPGQFVTVVLTLQMQTDAIQTGQKGDYVFVVKQDKTVENRGVTVDRTVGDEAVVSKGLSPGETVVTDGQLRLVPGGRVEISNGPGRKEAPRT